jgi:hypothetical protein
MNVLRFIIFSVVVDFFFMKEDEEEVERGRSWHQSRNAKSDNDISYRF